MILKKLKKISSLISYKNLKMKKNKFKINQKINKKKKINNLMTYNVKIKENMKLNF